MKLGVGGSITPQPGGNRAKRSFNRRAPPETPAFASSPASSAAEETSSEAPGGCTGPLAISPSTSKPCLGTASLRGVAPVERLVLVGGLRTLARLAAGACVDAFAEVFAGAPAALRAASRRGLERCGRVRGRLARTPVSGLEAFARPPLLDASLTRTSLLRT